MLAIIPATVGVAADVPPIYVSLPEVMIEYPASYADMSGTNLLSLFILAGLWPVVSSK